METSYSTTDFQLAYSAAQGLAGYCHRIVLLARGTDDGSYRSLRCQPEQREGFCRGEFESLKRQIVTLSNQIGKCASPLEQVGDVTQFYRVSGLSLHDAVNKAAHAFVHHYLYTPWPQLCELLQALPEEDLNDVQARLAKEWMNAERSVGIFRAEGSHENFLREQRNALERLSQGIKASLDAEPFQASSIDADVAYVAQYYAGKLPPDADRAWLRTRMAADYESRAVAANELLEWGEAEIRMIDETSAAASREQDAQADSVPIVL